MNYRMGVTESDGLVYVQFNWTDGHVEREFALVVESHEEVQKTVPVFLKHAEAASKPGFTPDYTYYKERPECDEQQDAANPQSIN